MINLNTYITEKFKISKDIKVQKYNYHPKDAKDLRKIIRKLLEKRGLDADLNDIDVSNITKFCWMNNVTCDMFSPFSGLDPHNIDISKWDVSNATDMGHMFYGCRNFNSDLSSWDVSNVTDMRFMFYRCHKFDCDLSNWDISNIKDIVNGTYHMFDGCNLLKNIPDWYHE